MQEIHDIPSGGPESMERAVKEFGEYREYLDSHDVIVVKDMEMDR